jgi:cobalt-zinc-cadmium efflux system protein
MDAVPEEIDSPAMRKYLSQRSGVTKVHDLRTWAVSTTETALTAHLVKPEREENEDEFLARTTRELHDRLRSFTP